MTRLRWIACVIITALAAGLCGCDVNKETNADARSEDIVLRWAIGGVEEQKDSQRVWDKFNEELQKYLPGTRVEFDCYASNDYAEKWKLISTSQEQFDIVWCGWMLDFVSEAKNGAYMPLDDLIDRYAPDIKKEIPETMLKKQTVDGQLYSIPCMQQMVSYVSTLSIELGVYEKYKQYINPEQLAQFFSSKNKMDKECWDKIEYYLELFNKNGDLPDGVKGFSSHAEKGYEWVRNPYKIEDFGEDYTPVNYYRTPEYKLFTDVYADWYEKGYIRQDILTTDRESTARYTVQGQGNYLIGQGYLPSESDIEVARRSGNEIFVHIPFYSSHYIPFAASASSTAISSGCKNPEQAIKLLELMNTKKGKDLYNLLVYGIEGEHYKRVDGNHIIPVGYTYTNTPDKKTPYGQYKWSVGNSFNAYEIYSSEPNPILENAFMKKVNDEAKPSKLMGFTLDTTPIKTELKQIDAVVEEYKSILNSGAAPDHEALYEEFVSKLILAGDDKVVEEIKRQIDEWRNEAK